MSPDINALVFLALREMAAVQTARPKAQAYARAAAAVWALERSLTDLLRGRGELPKIPALGPSSVRIIAEVIATGGSATVEAAVDASVRREAVRHARGKGQDALSRARVIEVLSSRARGSVGIADYRGDLQMHSTWSDGRATVADMAAACAARGYAWMAITDHAGGRSVSGGFAPQVFARQHDEIDRLNAGNRAIRILKGIEANIGADGRVDVTPEECARFEVVLAAPHAHLRVADDQTARLVRAVETPGVHVLAHPRGRQFGARAGIVADWDRVFAAAARRRVAVEIDGYAERQDLDHVLASRAVEAGCLFALDSDAHGVDQLIFAETAVAHARLARIPPSRVVNTWPVEKVLEWLAGKRPSRR